MQNIGDVTVCVFRYSMESINYPCARVHDYSTKSSKGIRYSVSRNWLFELSYRVSSPVSIIRTEHPPEKVVRKPSDIEMTHASDERALNRFRDPCWQVVQDVISNLRLRIKS